MSACPEFEVFLTTKLQQICSRKRLRKRLLKYVRNLGFFLKKKMIFLAKNLDSLKINEDEKIAEEFVSNIIF